MSAFLDITKRLEEHKNNVISNIDSLQAGLLPACLTIKWSKTDKYFYNNLIQVSRNPLETIFSIEGVRNNLLFNNEDKMYNDTMINSYNNNKIQAFLLFVNNKFIKWSDMTIIKNYSKFYIKVNNLDRDVTTTSVNIIYIPQNIKYVENSTTTTGHITLFRFNGSTGLLSSTGNIIISTSDSNINCNTYTGTTVLRHDLNIHKSVKITPTNVIVFKDNLLDTTASINIENLNIISINNGSNTGSLEYKVFYNDYSNKNLSSITILDNTTYLKNILKQTETNTRLDINTLKKNFDFSFNKNTDYNSNIQNNIDYIYDYNPKLLDNAYIDQTTVFTNTYTGAQINSMKDSSNKLTMNRLKYNGKETYVIVFLNGEIYNYYDQIVYNINSFTIPITGIVSTDTMEFVFFKNITNNVIKTTFTTTNKTIGTKTKNIDNINILSNYNTSGILNNNMMYKVGYTIQTDNTISYTNSIYYGKEVSIISENQFRYNKSIISAATTNYILPSKFNTCLDPEKYLIFKNHRLVNKFKYKISTEETSYTNMSIQFNIVLNANDILEVFYVPTKMINTATGFKLVTDIRKVKATTNNQSTFTIPFPYTNYINDKLGFMVSIGSVFIEPNRYNIVGNSIVLLDEEDYLDEGYEVTFIFIYNLLEDNEDIRITDETHIKLQTRTVVATVDNQSTFAIPISYTDGFLVIVGSTYIDPSRYTISGSNIVFRNSYDYVKLGRSVSFVFAHDTVNNIHIKLQSNTVTATVNNQTTFNIPGTYNDNFMVTRNTTVIDNTRYEIVDDTIVFIDSSDYIKLGDSITFIYLPDNLGTTINAQHAVLITRTVLSTTNNQTTFNIPFLYSNCIFNKDSFIATVGSTFIHPDRYTITNNKLVFTDGSGLSLGRAITFVFLYKTDDNEQEIIGGTTNKEFIKMETIPVEATTNNQLVFIAPMDMSEREFFITIGSVFIDENRYSVDKVTNTITFLSTDDAVPLGYNVFFTFVYSEFLTVSKKYANVVATTNNQTEFDIPVPNNNYFKMKNKFILFINSVYISDDRYTLDKVNNKLYFINNDIFVNTGCPISFIFFYSGDSIDNHRILPKHGYLLLNKRKTKFNLNKKLYFLFVNGKKIKEDDILDITNSLLRVKNDIKTRFNVVMLRHVPLIDELITYFTEYSEWENIYDDLTVSDINTLINITTEISDTETHIL